MATTSELVRTTVGQKLLLAATGIVLFLFVVGHLLGNLQIYRGPEALNAYAAFLHANPGPLWVARLLLLFSVGVHIVYAVRLAWRNWRTRPVSYARRRYRAADPAARSMIFTGPVIAAFVMYHLAHLTFGRVHPDFVSADVYHNVVAGFRVPLVAALYIVANILLALHLYHGLWSLTQTFGLAHRRWDGLRRGVATVIAAAIGLGNVSIPLAVWLELVR